jgi:hypothetical protein
MRSKVTRQKDTVNENQPEKELLDLRKMISNGVRCNNPFSDLNINFIQICLEDSVAAYLQ